MFCKMHAVLKHELWIFMTWILVSHYFPHLLRVYASKLELLIVLLCSEYMSDTSIYRDSFVYHVVAESATIDFRFQPHVHATASLRHESLLLPSKAVDPVVLTLQAFRGCCKTLLPNAVLLWLWSLVRLHDLVEFLFIFCSVVAVV